MLVLLAAFIVAARYDTGVGEWYSVTVYPVVSAVLSFMVCWIPVSMEEVFVLGAHCGIPLQIPILVFIFVISK